jgi:hypothetical protein
MTNKDCTEYSTTFYLCLRVDKDANIKEMLSCEDDIGLYYVERGTKAAQLRGERETRRPLGIQLAVKAAFHFPRNKLPSVIYGLTWPEFRSTRTDWLSVYRSTQYTAIYISQINER